MIRGLFCCLQDNPIFYAFARLGLKNTFKYILAEFPNLRRSPVFRGAERS